MKKIMLSVFTLILALAMLMTPVFAGVNLINPPDESEIQPKSAQCTGCLKGELKLYETRKGPWDYITTTESCMTSEAIDHGDEWYTRLITKIYRCTYCGDQDIRYSTEDKFVCT